MEYVNQRNFLFFLKKILKFADIHFDDSMRNDEDGADFDILIVVLMVE